MRTCVLAELQLEPIDLFSADHRAPRAADAIPPPRLVEVPAAAPEHRRVVVRHRRNHLGGRGHCASTTLPPLPPSAAPAPFDTVKNRLPIPSIAPWLSVTVHEIVCSPLVSVVVSIIRNPIAPFAPAVFWKPGEQRLDVRALVVVVHGPDAAAIDQHA